jgi:hypothetical protein
MWLQLLNIITQTQNSLLFHCVTLNLSYLNIFQFHNFHLQTSVASDSIGKEYGHQRKTRLISYRVFAKQCNHLIQLASACALKTAPSSGKKKQSCILVITLHITYVHF